MKLSRNVVIDEEILKHELLRIDAISELIKLLVTNIIENKNIYRETLVRAKKKLKKQGILIYKSHNKEDSELDILLNDIENALKISE